MEKLTSAELFYLRGLVEMDAHDGSKGFAKLAMALVKKLDKMHEEVDKQHYAILHAPSCSRVLSMLERVFQEGSHISVRASGYAGCHKVDNLTSEQLLRLQTRIGARYRDITIVSIDREMEESVVSRNWPDGHKTEV